MVTYIDAVIQGILLGGLYALFAAGLSLVFGVMRLVNIAHGDFIVLGAYIALGFVSLTSLHPFLTLVAVVPLMALVGYGLQRLILERTLGEDLLPPILVTFGMAVIIQNGLLTLFSTDAQRLGAGSIETASVPIGSINIGVLPLLTFVIALVLVALMEKVFFRSRIGRAFRATSDDAETARAIGVNTRHVFGLAMALSFGVIAIAAVLLAARSSFDPFSGPGAPALRVRGGDHRRVRKPVGNAGRRHRSRRRADPGRADLALVPDPRGSRRLFHRAGGAAARFVPKDGLS